MAGQCYQFHRRAQQYLADGCVQLPALPTARMPVTWLLICMCSLDEDENGFIMALVLGDWLDDIGYDPTHSIWEP